MNFSRSLVKKEFRSKDEKSNGWGLPTSSLKGLRKYIPLKVPIIGYYYIKGPGPSGDYATKRTQT